MRISDWSSDVCSSDLDDKVEARHDIEPPVEKAEGANQVSGGGGNQRSSLPLFHRAYRIFAAVEPPQPPISGIGRRTVEHRLQRSEARRVGKECVSKGQFRLSPYH